MGMFDKLKNIFKKEEEPKEHPKVDGKRNVERCCDICGEEIGAERYSYQQGHYFHKKCYKKAKKQALAGKSIHG